MFMMLARALVINAVLAMLVTICGTIGVLLYGIAHAPWVLDWALGSLTLIRFSIDQDGALELIIQGLPLITLLLMFVGTGLHLGVAIGLKRWRSV